MFKIIETIAITYFILASSVLISQEMIDNPIREGQFKLETGIGTTQSYYKYWAEGGENSVTGKYYLDAEHNYWNGYRFITENKFDAVLGFTKSEGINLRKSDDKLEFSSKLYFGEIFSKKFYYNIRLNVKSQFMDGFNYPDDSTVISRFFAPAYSNLGAGIILKIPQLKRKVNKDDPEPKLFFTLGIYPVNLKSTVVLNKQLSDSGAFGVEPGKSIRNDFGSSIEMNYKQTLLDRKVFKFILESNLLATNAYFSSYKKINESLKPLNFDVDWESIFVVESEISEKFSLNTKLGVRVKYDEDTPILLDSQEPGVIIYGPRTQFKEVLEIGIRYKFLN